MSADLSPTPLELAVGALFGPAETEPPLEPAPPGLTPVDALDRALVAALERPPCLVAFSGGRDSALLLARAVVVARREGLAPPIPITARFENAPGSREDDWQELILGRYPSLDWIRLELGDELDLVGARARAMLLEHGVLHPPHTPLFGLLAEHAPGGALVTGFGGDQILGGWMGSRDSDLLGARGPTRAAKVAAFRLAPRRARRYALAARVPDRPWLTTRARAGYERRWLELAASEPTGWSDYLGWAAGKRTMVGLRRSLELATRPSGTVVGHPLLDRTVLSALAAAGGRRGLGDRTELMRLLAGGELPEPVVSRSTKAHFHHVFFRSPSRTFARAWGGSGLPGELVDADAVRAAWLGRMPRGASALALQAAWLSEQREGAGDRLGKQLDPAGPA